MRINQALQPFRLNFCSSSRSARSDVFGLSLGNLPDAVLGSATGLRAPPNAPPGWDEVGVATGVREGIGGAAGTPASLEGWRLFLFLLYHLHLVPLPVSLDLGDDGKWASNIAGSLFCLKGTEVQGYFYFGKLHNFDMKQSWNVIELQLDETISLLKLVWSPFYPPDKKTTIPFFSPIKWFFPP